MAQNTCPKCGEKLSPFYFKQTCPKCGVNLFYYEMDKRLEQDNIKAEAEAEYFEKVLDNIKRSTIRGVLPILRLISFLLPVAALCLPVLKVEGVPTVDPNVSLISLITRLLSRPEGEEIGAFLSDVLLKNTPYLMAAAIMVSVVVFFLVTVIAALFTYSKKGLTAALIVHISELVTVGALAAVAISGGATAAAGLIAVGVCVLLSGILTVVLGKSLRK